VDVCLIEKILGAFVIIWGTKPARKT